MREMNACCFCWGDWVGNQALRCEYVKRLFYGLWLNHSDEWWKNHNLNFTIYADTKNYEALVQYRDSHHSEDSTEIHAWNIIRIDSPSWIGCLPKLNIYNPEIQPKSGPILVFDLDTVIVGELDPFWEAITDGLTTRAWFKGIQRGLWLSGGDLLGFNPGWQRGHYIWDLFSRATEYIETKVSEGGRERFVYRKMVPQDQLEYWQRSVPAGIVSYKNHIRPTGILPADARMVSCHGNPRPHELIGQEWLLNHWRHER